jgi:alpha-beta hydrolase superfamily lysophospholipase
VSYADALEALDRVAARERADAAINPQCYSRWMVHGKQTADSVVLWHGFTNCPDQFVRLGTMLFERGYNVYIPLMPRHGLRDRMTDALALLTQAELKMAGIEAMRIAFGLGKRANTMGLSLGGVMSAWIAQAAHIGTTVAISPFFALPWFGRAINDYVTRLMLWLPNHWVWWDPRLKENCKPDHAYPRFPTHALATLMEFGEGAFRVAEHTPPLAQRCVLALNARDPAINLGVAKQLWTIWQHRAEMVETFEFTDLPAIHDIIEPTTFTEAPVLVYPRLVALMLRANGEALPIPSPDHP